MPEITKKGFKKPVLNEPYDLNIVNYNTDKTNELFENQDQTNENLNNQISLKQNKTDNNLNTNNKTIVGAINENKINIDLANQQMEQKADKTALRKISEIGLGGNGDIRLIGKITNMTQYNLEAMLHNMYHASDGMQSNAFIMISKQTSFNIQGKMHILNDRATSFKTKIIITDIGNIYAVNDLYKSNITSWNIFKTSNILIYDNPDIQIVSVIEGNVIWDSELNKTTIATTDHVGQQMEQKADKEKYTLNSYTANNQVELDNILNNYSANLGSYGKYNFGLWVKFSGTLTGGTYEVEGYKASNGYEIQQAKVYSIQNLIIKQRCCYNGVWSNWVDIVTSEQLEQITDVRKISKRFTGTLVQLDDIALNIFGIPTTNTNRYICEVIFNESAPPYLFNGTIYTVIENRYSHLYRTQVAISYTKNGCAIKSRAMDNGVWSSWTIVATTDKIDISFATRSAFTASGSSKITKQNDIVQLNFNLSGTFTANTSVTIFDLPAGYRPSTNPLRMIVACTDSNNVCIGFGFLSINTNGVANVYTFVACSNIVMTNSFIVT